MPPKSFLSEHHANASELRIGIPIAATIFVLYAVLVYWPVLIGHRFFWEDFFIKEFPIRYFSYYMAGRRHVLPFWNPYSFGWEPFMADAQCGFWYPANLLQIAIGFLTGASHLLIVLPESMAILHMVVACLGIFVLLRSEFQLRDITSVLAAVTFGFGARMVAEQNHVVFVYQLALLPWETFLLMRSWRSWKYAVGLGILFGISFLAGQPQVFLFVAFFLLCLTLWQCWFCWQKHKTFINSFRPLVGLAIALIVTAGTAAIQLLPLLELTHDSPRQHLGFEAASMGSMHPFRFITFFVPKFFGEFPSYSTPASVESRANAMWYWEGTFYWGVLPEILALFGILRLWKERKSSNPRARHISFFVGFSIFATLYGLGSYGGVQWLFWRFVPIFDHVRMPNRMVWFVWFIGSLATGLGLEELLSRPNLLQEYRRYFYSSTAIFVSLNLLAMSGFFHSFIRPHHYQQIPSVMMHSLIASVAVLLFFYLYISKKLPLRWLLPCATLLIVADLYYVDYTWHRNTLDRQSLVAMDSKSAPILEFERLHGKDHSKLLLLQAPELLAKEQNLGMFLKIPIEFSADSNALLGDNPMRLVNIFPPIRDSVRRMEIMGVSMTVDPDGHEYQDSLALPFVRLYHSWIIAPTREGVAEILNDSTFNFRSSVVLGGTPQFPKNQESAVADTAVVSNYSENRLDISVWASKPCILLVNDLYYPAWHAKVDGNPTRILRAFCSLRAVAIPAGFHQVEMEYRSILFSWGWKLSAITLLFSFFALIPYKRRSRVLRRPV